MIDTLEIAIPFGVDFVQVVNGRHEFVDVDLKTIRYSSWRKSCLLE